eukprot:TRINITY_DN32991_c0_g1_i1.p1 TRINITY_DN32991_c0_g1~~TRINITY_DN32991_c0_g1_i1.p1  ORF type:complete len:409 (+),score=77.22 TRINITY_DN32991_c0_g1_i1:123-1349(+)
MSQTMVAMSRVGRSVATLGSRSVFRRSDVCLAFPLFQRGPYHKLRASGPASNSTFRWVGVRGQKGHDRYGRVRTGTSFHGTCGGTGSLGGQAWKRVLKRGQWRFPLGMRKGPWARSFSTGGPFRGIYAHSNHHAFPARRKAMLLKVVASLIQFDTIRSKHRGLAVQLVLLLDEIVQMAKRGTAHDRRRIFSMFRFKPSVAHRVLDEFPYRFRFRERGVLEYSILPMFKEKGLIGYVMLSLRDKDQIPRLPGEMPLEITRWDQQEREKFGYRLHPTMRHIERYAARYVAWSGEVPQPFRSWRSLESEEDMARKAERLRELSDSFEVTGFTTPSAPASYDEDRMLQADARGTPEFGREGPHVADTDAFYQEARGRTARVVRTWQHNYTVRPREGDITPVGFPRAVPSQAV